MISIAIQAGGESRRMGRNKALVPFGGQALIAHVAARLAGLGDELFVTAKQPDLYAFLGLPVYPDVVPGQGALGGLLTALRRAKHPALGVIACDMPFASPALLQYQFHLLSEKKADIVVPLTGSGFEPLHAVYRTEVCLPVVEAAIAAGEWKLSGWFGQVEVISLAADDWSNYDPDGVVFTNLNTPDEFSKAERYARTHPGQ